MKVYVVIGVYAGIVDRVAVTTSEETKSKRRNEFDEELGIERDNIGDYEHPENDVLVFEEEVERIEKNLKIISGCLSRAITDEHSKSITQVLNLSRECMRTLVKKAHEEGFIVRRN